MLPRRESFVGCCLALLLLAAAQSLPGRKAYGHPPFGRPLMEEFAVQDAASPLLGLRRLGGDLSFLQMLQYYGSEEGRHNLKPRKKSPYLEHEEGVHLHMDMEGSGDLPDAPRLTDFEQLVDYALRTGAVEPFFRYSYLFTAGALAFNLNRDDEALFILEKGAAADPSFWRFRLYAGAIAFRKSREIEKAVALLEEALRYPDCPSMLKNILAGIHKKQGNYRRAAEIYLQLAQASRDPNYVELGRLKFRELVEKHGLVFP